MQLALVIYGISVLQNVGVILALLWFIGVGAWVIFAIGCNIEKGKDDLPPETRKLLKRTAIILAILTLVCAVIPGKKTMYAMLAAYGGQAVAQSETVQRLAPKTIQLLEQYMDKQLEESDK